MDVDAVAYKYVYHMYFVPIPTPVCLLLCNSANIGPISHYLVHKWHAYSKIKSHKHTLYNVSDS